MASYYSCDVKQPPSHYPEKLATEYNFPLDPFQKHAISAIDQEHNVLVCAKTGSGKTLVGEYQIAHSLKKRKRVFYTTPIKSLSNQKFHDLKQMYPGIGQVGIMTGDIKFCPDADIVIMTTEILRNLLYKVGTKTEHLGLTSSLSTQNLDAVIFDECHYINDKDRGKVWEETMILLPQHVKLVLLSATLDSPELFASWLGQLRERPIALIQTQYRVVPLSHHVLCGKEPLTLMDAKETFDAAAYNQWLIWRKTQQKSKDDFKAKVQNARLSGHEGPVDGKVTIAKFVHTMNQTIGDLYAKEMLPALYFVFNRKDCEKYANKVEHCLLDSSDSALADRIFDFHLRHHKANLETIPQYHHLKHLIVRGIAFHHSGILPILKEVVEILFSKGLIKLLFCTETFAVGINMPTKTVLFAGLTKYDTVTQGHRMLRTDEYIQMAGRAGRRGKDTVGYVFYLPDREPPDLGEMKTMMKGGKPRLESRMDFHYDFLLKTLNTGCKKWLSLMQNSYWFKQHETVQEGIQKEMQDKEERLVILNGRVSEEALKEVERKMELEERIKLTQNAKRKEAQRELDRWKDTHIGPKWTIILKDVEEIRSTQKELTSLKNCYEVNSHYTDSVTTRLKFLEAIDYMEKDSEQLTQRGIVATEFNEGHPFLCTELLYKQTLDNLEPEEIVAVLAAFVSDSDKDDSPDPNSLAVPRVIATKLHELDDIAAAFCKKEKEVMGFSEPEYWSLSTMWIEPIWRWLQGEHMGAIAADYGLFEGNLVRAILRVANLMDEWTAAATFLEQIPMLKKMEGLKARLVKDVVVPDSLYLHL